MKRKAQGKYTLKKCRWNCLRDERSGVLGPFPSHMINDEAATLKKESKVSLCGQEWCRSKAIQMFWCPRGFRIIGFHRRWSVVDHLTTLSDLLMLHTSSYTVILWPSEIFFLLFGTPSSSIFVFFLSLHCVYLLWSFVMTAKMCTHSLYRIINWQPVVVGLLSPYLCGCNLHLIISSRFFSLLCQLFAFFFDFSGCNFISTVCLFP